MRHIKTLSAATPKQGFAGAYPNDHKKCLKFGKCAAEQVPLPRE